MGEAGRLTGIGVAAGHIAVSRRGHVAALRWRRGRIAAFRWRRDHVAAGPGSAFVAAGEPFGDKAGRRRVSALVAKPVKEIFHLVAPQLALVFDFPFAACKIFDDKDSLVGHFRFLDAEFKKLLGWSVHPMETNEFFKFTFGYYRFVGCAIPGKTEHIIPFVYFICKPLLQSCRRA